jgi:hypothetical protein
MFIIIDISTINNLWGENFHRRCLHHLQRNQFNPNKKPVIHFLDKKLDKSTIDYALNVKFDENKNCLQNISFRINKLFGGGYSNKCFLYYNDFDNETQLQLDKIGESMIPYLEQFSGKKLYLGKSDFRCVLLKYEGINSEFTPHYDTEPAVCYRTLFLFHKEGNPPPFFYYDKNGVKHTRNFDVGEGVFFKGTQTRHGVDKNKDPNMKRYMIGWQYTTDPKKEDVSLCSKLRSKTGIEVIKEFLPHILFTLSISLLIWHLSNDKITYVQRNSLLILTLIVTLLSTFLPRKLHKLAIGTGLRLNHTSFFVFMGLALISFGNIYYSLLFFNYVIVTEMFIPRSIIGKSLKLVENV